MNYLVNHIFQSKLQTKEIGWFRTALYLFLLYKVCIYCIHFDVLFSSEHLIYNSPRSVGFVTDLAFFLSHHYSVLLAILFISMLGFLSIIGLLKKSNYISNFLLWFIVMNIHNYTYACLTGGDYLLNQLLLFNIFFSTQKNQNQKIEDLKIALHNTALAGIKIQICLLYLISAFYKLGDPSWLNGSAISQISQVPEYSTAFLASLPDFICTVLTYLSLTYQLLFPVLIWIRPFKLYVFAFGILQHVMIAFTMGLFGFSGVMLICYILFLKYDNKF